MRRLEERVICKDAAGTRYVVEVYRTLERLADGTQELGPRDAVIAVVGDIPPRPLKVFDDEDVFETEAGQILRRVKGGEPDVKRQGRPVLRLRKINDWAEHICYQEARPASDGSGALGGRPSFRNPSSQDGRVP